MVQYYDKVYCTINFIIFKRNQGCRDMSKSHIRKITSVKNITESEAREFCLQVQRCFKSGVPPFKEIAKVVQLSPYATTKDIALVISPNLIYDGNFKLSKRKNKKGTTLLTPMSSDRKYVKLKPKSAPSHPWLSDKELIRSVASLIPDEDKGNEEIANHILIDFARSMPNAARILTSEQVIKILKRVKRSGNWDFRQLMVEARKEVYGYSGDHHPWIKVVSIPMGGKPR